jgi:hypothetical protein
MASAEFAEATVTGASGTKTTTVDITNNSTGINNAYVDGMKDTNRVTQLSRYYLKVKKATISGSGNCSIDSPNNAIVAPGQTLSLNTSTTYVADANDSSSYEVVITYDIVDKNGNAITDADGNVLFTNLTTFCYQYMSGKTSWKEEVYPDGLVSTSTSNYNVKTTSGFGSGSYLKVTYPEYMVLGTTSLSDISSYNLILANTKGGVTAADRSLDGAFFYDEGTVYTNDLTTAESTYNSSASQVTVTSANAIPVYNTETGDLLHEEWYDYRVETYAGSGVYGEWQRNQVTEVTNENNSTAITFYKGYTEDEISSFVKSANSSGLAIETRTHVVYTLQEALDAKIIKAYHVNANGVYDAMYLQSGVGNYKYDDLLNIITMRGPVDGIYMNSTKIKLSKGSTSNFSWFRYDGSTAIQAGSYEVKLNCYNGNSCGYANFTLVIGDTSSVDSLATSYNELASLLTNYRKSDFTDYNKDTGTSAVFDEAQAALLNALGAQSAVLTPTSALTLSDDTQLTAVTKQTTSQTGDKAYVPFTTANDSTLPNSIKDAAYVGGATVNGDTLPGVAGVYYYDANCTMPIYSSVPLTSKDVDKDGNDPAGMPVIEVDGVYYLANSVVYETEWDTETYGATAPWAVATDTQATNSKGQLLYDQVQYVYRNASGSKVNSTDNWVCKLPQTSYQLIPNTGDANEEHRGTITQAADYITYAKEMVLSSINTSIAQDLYEKVSLVRDNLNSKNFEVVTYNKMVDAAKEAESNYSVVITYTNDDGEQVQQTVSYSSSKSIIENLKNNGVEYTVTTSSTLSSLQVEEYLRLFNFYMSKVVERGYIGDALEAEIECASGNSYANLVATKATYDEDGNQLTTATVTKGTSAGDPAFGAWSADGTLVNEGATVYSEKTWNAYVDALANAVYLATLGNTTYAHADRAYYDVSDKDNYSARVTGVATADVELQKAEIALTEVASVTITGVETAGATLVVDGTSYTSPVTFEKGETVTIDAIIEDGYTYSGYVLVNGDKKFTSLPFDLYLEKDYEIQPVVEASAPEGITISGTITIAKDAVGTDSGFAVEGINIVAGGEVVATSASDGTFTATVPVGTTELKITGDTTVDRTVTLSGTTDVTDVVIPVIDCDYNRDSYVNMTDFSTFLKYYEVEYYAYADFNGDKTVNMTDLTSFLKIYDNDVVYDALSLD